MKVTATWIRSIFWPIQELAVPRLRSDKSLVCVVWWLVRVAILSKLLSPRISRKVCRFWITSSLRTELARVLRIQLWKPLTLDTSRVNSSMWLKTSLLMRKIVLPTTVLKSPLLLWRMVRFALDSETALWVASRFKTLSILTTRIRFMWSPARLSLKMRLLPLKLAVSSR